MRKISVILLVLMILYGSAHYIVYLTMIRAIKQEVKKEMKQNLKLNDLETFEINANQDLPSGAVWEETGKEFSLNGKMFDIVKTITKGNKKILNCINDTREANLKNHYAAIFHADFGRKRDMSNKHLKSLRLISFFLIPGGNRIMNTEKDTSIDFSDLSAPIIPGFFSITSPPPEFV